MPPTQTPGSREFLEDVDDADRLEDQQHQEHDADHRQRTGAGRRVGDLPRQHPQLRVGKGSEPRLDLGRIDAQCRELLAHLVPREYRIDGCEVLRARVGLHRLERANEPRLRDQRRTEVQNGDTQQLDEQTLEHLGTLLDWTGPNRAKSRAAGVGEAAVVPHDVTPVAVRRAVSCRASPAGSRRPRDP
jgi:hypothetical protein